MTAGLHTIFSAFRIQFVDYTKNGMLYGSCRQLLPHILAVRSNEPDALRLLAAGHNVVVVFANRPQSMEWLSCDRW